MKQRIALIVLSFFLFSCGPSHEDYYRDAIGMYDPHLINKIDDLEYSVKDGWAFGALREDSVCYVTKFPLSNHELGHVDVWLEKFQNNYFFLELLPAIRDFEQQNNLKIRGMVQQNVNTFFIRTTTSNSLIGPDTTVQFVSIFRGLE
jgi:hypothetical protein